MFELESVQGTATQIKADLEGLPKHEREEKVIPVIKQAIDSIVEAVGGYLSVSSNGNLNPVAGDTGDLVQIYITSLPYPPNYTSGEAPAVEVEENQKIQVSLAPVLPPAVEPGPETGQENTEIPPATISLYRTANAFNKSRNHYSSGGCPSADRGIRGRSRARWDSILGY